VSQARRERPTRRELDPAALRLLERHGDQILATARRYSATPEDAEDAYQRGLEILLTKAPTTEEDELVPWLRTVVKHEAFAIRRQRERATPTTEDGEMADPPGSETATHEQAERYERLRLGAEAMRRLKPQEVRCLVLKAEGYSYREICEVTGWTYTKVNRCLTEGRRALLARVAGIESGGECLRLEPLLSALADGEASADDMRALRPHLRSCLTCRARLRAFRAVPARVAVLAPAVVAGGGLRSVLESLLGAAQHKAALIGERAHSAVEVAAGQKAVAVAASAAALAGGGATVDRLERPAHSARPAREAAAPAPLRSPTPPKAPVRPPEPVPDPSPPAPAPPEPVEAAVEAPAEFGPGGPAPVAATSGTTASKGEFSP
jgi:RNA polymerase sigma factor (sigma-70 family)